MTRNNWTEDELAGAVQSKRPPSEEESRASCFHPDLYWHLAQGELAGALSARMLDHAATCSDCFLALRLARTTSAEAPELASALGGRPAPSARFWGPLGSAAFYSAIAAATLLLAVVSALLYRSFQSAPTSMQAPHSVAVPGAVPAALRSVRTFALTGDVALRGGDAPAPLLLPAGADEAVALNLFPDLEELSGKTDATALSVRVLDGNQVLTELERRVSDLASNGSLTLLLDTALLRAGTTYRVDITTAGPEPPQLLLRQSLQIEPRP
jgi:hypothetical protein